MRPGYSLKGKISIARIPNRDFKMAELSKVYAGSTEFFVKLSMISYRPHPYQNLTVISMASENLYSNDVNPRFQNCRSIKSKSRKHCFATWIAWVLIFCAAARFFEKVILAWFHAPWIFWNPRIWKTIGRGTDFSMVSRPFGQSGRPL